MPRKTIKLRIELDASGWPSVGAAQELVAKVLIDQLRGTIMYRKGTLPDPDTLRKMRINEIRVKQQHRKG